MFKRLEKIDWRKGSSFLEFAVISVLLLSLLLVIIGLFIKRFTVERCDMYADAIARDLVTCTSLDEAKDKANDELSYFEIPYVENMSVTVDYALGSRQEWKKGNYIVVSFTGEISSVSTLTKTTYNADVMKMIENSNMTP